MKKIKKEGELGSMNLHKKNSRTCHKEEENANNNLNRIL